MIISIRQIKELLDATLIETLVSGPVLCCFMGTLMPETTPEIWQPGNVYFLKTSMVPESMAIQDVGLVLVRDDDRDLSACSCDRLILKPGTDLTMVHELTRRRIEQLAAEGCALENLLSALYQDKRIKEILDLSSDFLKNPLVLYVTQGKSVMLMHSYIADSRNNLKVPDYYDTSNSNQAQIAMHFADFERMIASAGPIMYSAGVNFSGDRRIGTLVRDEAGTMYGGLVLYERNRPLEEIDFLYVHIISRIIGQQKGSLREISYTKNSYEQHLLDLLKGKTDNRDRTWLKYIHGDRYQNFRLLALNFADADSRCRSRMEAFFAMEKGNCLIVRKQEYLVILTNLKTDGEWRQFQTTAETAMCQQQLTSGVSEVFSDVENLRCYFDQAVKAQRYGSATGSDRHLFHYQQIKYHILFNELPRDFDLVPFISSNYRRLQQHDLEKGTAFCQTLICYIECNGNRKAACSHLQIHRNTLPQRLERIEQLLGSSVDSTELLFDIYFSHLIDTFQRPND